MTNIKELSAGLDISREAALNALFATMPSEIDVFVDLPSKGKFYAGFNGVKVSALLFEDEYKILLSKNNSVNPINSILEKCVHGIRLSDILILDKLYLLLKVREVSYGSEYKFDIICPNCKQNVATTIDISKTLNVNYFPEDFTDPRDVKLPLLNATVKVRLPRIADEIFMGDSDAIISNIHRFVVSINDNNDPVFISRALARMHIRDKKTILKAISRNDLGIDPSFQFECPHCKHSAKLEVPLTASFFSVS